MTEFTHLPAKAGLLFLEEILILVLY